MGIQSHCNACATFFGLSEYGTCYLDVNHMFLDDIEAKTNVDEECEYPYQLNVEETACVPFYERVRQLQGEYYQYGQTEPGECVDGF